VQGTGRQSLELLLLINSDQVCTVAETVHAEAPSALGEPQADLLNGEVQQKDQGGDAETAQAKPEVFFLKFRHGSFLAGVFSSTDFLLRSTID